MLLPRGVQFSFELRGWGKVLRHHTFLKTPAPLWVVINDQSLIKEPSMLRYCHVIIAWKSGKCTQNVSICYRLRILETLISSFCRVCIKCLNRTILKEIAGAVLPLFAPFLSVFNVLLCFVAVEALVQSCSFSCVHGQQCCFSTINSFPPGPKSAKYT